jgi:hypothetical protein
MRDAPPPERTFWESFPKRSLRRVLFLLAILLVVVALKRSGGGAFRDLLNFMGSSSPPTKANAARDDTDRAFQRLNVVPPSAAGGGPP